MRYMSCDQSITHAAYCIWEDGEVIHRGVIRTGDVNAKQKKKGVVYLPTIVERIHLVCKTLWEEYSKFACEHYVMESLSFSSTGNATRDLAGLFYCIELTFFLKGVLINTVTPTAAKSFARGFLPKEMQEVEQLVTSKKHGAKKALRKVKMDKPQMMDACDCANPGWLDGVKIGEGKPDLADAYFIGRYWYEKMFLTDGC